MADIPDKEHLKPRTARIIQLENKLAKSAAKSNNSIQSNTSTVEDEFSGFYGEGTTDGWQVIKPPFDLRQLDRMPQENNALMPCIEALVTNIDGTGYDFEVKGDRAEDKADMEFIKQIEEFFDEPWPGMSFTTIRKNIRRDIEKLGNGFIEVIRNPQDEIVFLNYMDAKLTRLVKYDAPILVEQTVRRNGQDITINLSKRERRFCQIINGNQLTYFKEFGASRDLNKHTGKWAEVGERLPAKERATEVLHFTAVPDTNTPYGIPRWIGQTPSVLGSRKAEEYNLDFFDNGGVPPVLILLQGGQLQPETNKALDMKMNGGSATSRNRVQVLEIMPTDGTFDRPSSSRVTVERFGAERQNDSMFEKYDEKCEIRVRRAFRLPPIFVGAANDYSFASAAASYQVAEAQVFKPERDEFDEIINVTLMKELAPDYKFVSKPLVIEDATLKLRAIELAVGIGGAEKEDAIYEINEAAGTNIKYAGPQNEMVTEAGVDPENIATLEEEAPSPPSENEPVGAGYTTTIKAACGQPLNYDDIPALRFGLRHHGDKDLSALTKATMQVMSKAKKLNVRCDCGSH